jgi:hypothetical protein
LTQDSKGIWTTPGGDSVAWFTDPDGNTLLLTSFSPDRNWPTTVSRVTVELIPLCTIEVTLADPIIVGEGPAGVRLIYEVLELTVEGDRLRGNDARARGR